MLALRDGCRNHFERMDKCCRAGLRIAALCLVMANHLLAQPESEAVRRDLTSESRTSRGARMGQVWREYDLRTYFQYQRGANTPAQTVIDWVLRETGTDRWFGEVAGMMTIEEDRLLVFHVPEVQQRVAEIVDRLTEPSLHDSGVAVRLVTVESINWRAVATPLMQPVTVQTPGVEAWLMSKENAAILLAHLRQRVDYREHNSAQLVVGHGQTQTVERWQPRSYDQSVRPTPTRYPGYQRQQAQIREGYSLQLSPLLHLDGAWMDLAVQCRVDQIERIGSVGIDVPTVSATQTRVQIEVPQVSSWQIRERFRWPVDQVLLVSRGVVAMPGLKSASVVPLPRLIAGRSPARADALLFLECRGESKRPESLGGAGPRVSRLNYHGRY